MSEVRYSESLHILFSSFAAAMNDAHAFIENGVTREVLTLSDVFRALNLFDDDAKEAFVTLMTLDLRPWDDAPDGRYSLFLNTSTALAAMLPEISSRDFFENEETPFWENFAWKLETVLPVSIPLVHYSPLGSPDYILEFKPETEDDLGFVTLEVWSAAFRWFGISDHGLTKGKLIGQFALTPSLAEEKKSGRKPWRFNSLSQNSYEYVITEAIHASQIYTVCNSCDEVKDKLGFTSSGSDADTCDSCLGLIH